MINEYEHQQYNHTKALTSIAKRMTSATVKVAGPKKVHRWAGPGLMLTLLAFYAAVLLWVRYRLQWTPEPLPVSAPEHLFSEARAMVHIKALAEIIGDRQVSCMPGSKKGAKRSEGVSAAFIAPLQRLYPIVCVAPVLCNVFVMLIRSLR